MNHKKFMLRCVELAKKGLGMTYPNPLVGSVIVHEGKIVGEGWHRKAGTAHAEVIAINSVADERLLPECTLYVNLEPCCHFGKTPPCADLIIEKRIPRVVIGTPDPHVVVAGNGIRKLKEAGIDVTFGICEDACNDLNKRFFSMHRNNRPYVVLKWAESADGFLSPASREKHEPFWLSGSFSRQLVHKWRTEEQSILVGTQTVIDDDPMLTARTWDGPQPIRIAIDRIGNLPSTAKIFRPDTPTITFISGETARQSDIQIPFENLPSEILNTLFDRGVQSVLIEGGRKTLESFISAGLWDEARIFRCPVVLGGGTKAPDISGKLLQREMIGSDELVIFCR